MPGIDFNVVRQRISMADVLRLLPFQPTSGCRDYARNKRKPSKEIQKTPLDNEDSFRDGTPQSARRYGRTPSSGMTTAARCNQSVILSGISYGLRGKWVDVRYSSENSHCPFAAIP